MVVFGCTLATCAAAGASRAQTERGPDWNQARDPYVAALGLTAGLTSGTGVAVRWPALPQTMAGIAGGIWKQGDASDWNVGFELHLVLRQAYRTRLFVGPAVAAYHDGADDETDWNASLGVGIEYLMRSRLALKADVGFTYKSSNEDILPLPQVGILYYF
jgi:hypothetical protein